MRLSEHTYRTISTIAGPLLFVEKVQAARIGEVVRVVMPDGRSTDAEVLEIDGETVLIEVYGTTQGVDIEKTTVTFTDAIKQVPLSPDIVGRIFNGSFVPKDGAPLFIPGVGALVMLKEHITDPVTDARIGLAGPVWGLGAAVASWLAFLATGAPIWLAITELTGFLNLFNLIPIWQLDGSRGFHALSRPQRWIVLGVIAFALWLTGGGVLWIVGAVALYRTLRDEAGPGHQPTMVTFAGLVIALAWFARHVVTRTPSP